MDNRSNKSKRRASPGKVVANHTFTIMVRVLRHFGDNPRHGAHGSAGSGAQLYHFGAGLVQAKKSRP